jgi:outer membrane protein OmpA-like peptidoglycan-associated protein
MNKISMVVLGAAAAATAGCTTNLNGGSLGETFFAEGFLDQEIGGSDYNASLARAYQEIAAYNANTDVNWLDTTVYMDRSRMAAAGNPPELFMPSEYGVNGDLEALRAQVIEATSMHASARPAECAGMAAYYDFLVEQTYQTPGTNPDNARAKFDAEYSNCVGTPVSDMTVFFGFNVATLDAVATSIVDDIAASISGATSAVSVVGHTDTVGSLEYNQRLSERRANNVADRLSAMGVDSGRITQAGRSWLEPAVPTGPGVREARNRRVEIVVGE